jgi:hypothetical protein
MPLQRHTPLKRNQGLGRGKPLRHARRPQRHPAIYLYACDIEGEVAECWLAQFSATPCEGRMTRAHLLSKQDIRKQIWLPAQRGESGLVLPDTLKELQDDPRTWRPGCWSHHLQFDFSLKLRVPRESIPAETEQFAEEFKVGWLLDRRYGPLPATTTAGVA